MGKIKSILFVCTGNSCRSIMAEGLLKKYLKAAGKGHIEVRSAGVASLGGLPPTLETMTVMKAEGIDVSGTVSKKITEEMIRDADLILAMEELHREEILRITPWAARKVHLLKEFGLKDKKQQHPGIPDPMGRPVKDYEQCFGTIKKEIERIAKIL
jgi:protein-tyrosine-phosphatase